MNKFRRDVVRVALRQKHWRLALTLLFLPENYALSREEDDERSHRTRK